MSQRVVQLTDLHLQANADDLYKGIHADGHFLQCLAWLAKQDYDLLLLTGDLAHGATPKTYARLHAYLDQLDKPWCWLPGNHDEPQYMLAVSAQAVDQVRVVEMAAWRLLLVDSTQAADGCGAGSISDAGLQQLREHLSASFLPTVLVMHHNPIPVKSAWQDKIMLANAHELQQVVAGQHHVKAVVFGHIHQTLDCHVNGIRYLGAPATSVQFKAQQQGFTLQPEYGPGLRVIDLGSDGRLLTDIVRLPKKEWVDA